MIIIINIFPMTFPKHVIQSCAGQEEIHPFTLALALPYTTRLTTGPKFSSVSKWQYHNHTAPLYSLNSSWGCKTYNCLSSRRNAWQSKRKQGKKKKNTQLHKYPLEFIFNCLFFLQTSRRQKFQFNCRGLKTKTTKEARRIFRSLWEQSAVSFALRSMTMRTVSSTSLLQQA